MKFTFDDIDLAFSFANFGSPGEHEACLNPKTGAVYYRSEYDSELDDEDNPNSIPDDIDRTTLIWLPHKNDLHLGKALVINFTAHYMPEQVDKVYQIFSARGAYARFKDLLEREDMLQSWYEFEAFNEQQALLAWCGDNDIEVTGAPSCKPLTEPSSIAEKINYLELPATDIHVARTFFATAFGWEFTDYGPDYTAFSNAGLDGGFCKSDQVMSSSNGSALVVLYSSNLEQTQSKIEAAGGTITKPVFAFPGGHRFHFTDPNGNEYAVWSDRFA